MFSCPDVYKKINNWDYIEALMFGILLPVVYCVDQERAANVSLSSDIASSTQQMFQSWTELFV